MGIAWNISCQRNGETTGPPAPQMKLQSKEILTLGNLAIIPQALNASIRDSDWTTKKSGKGANKPGLEACAKGLVTLNAVLLEDEWTEEKIDARAKWLHEIAETLWNIQP